MGAAGHGSVDRNFTGLRDSIDTQSASRIPEYIAMWARRYMIETGATYEGSRRGCHRAEGVRTGDDRLDRGSLHAGEHLASPFVADPSADQTARPKVDGACALVVTTLDRARDLRHSPAGFVELHTPWHRSGLDIGMPCSGRTTHATTQACSPRRSGPTPVSAHEIDFAELYDCFSSTVCSAWKVLASSAGEAAALCERETQPPAAATTNTNGGLLCEGYLHGMNTVAEQSCRPGSKW